MFCSTRFIEAKGALLFTALAGAIGLGCDSGPCHGSECAGVSSGSGDFQPGPLPHSALTLEGPRCASGGARVEVFQHRLFTEPDPPAVVHANDPLTVYWSVCNTGDLPSTLTSGAYDYVVQSVASSGNTELQRVGFDIPALVPCQCSVESRNLQNALTPGKYNFALTGALTADVTRVITE